MRRNVVKPRLLIGLLAANLALTLIALDARGEQAVSGC
jgi:hypothetical protein